MKFGEQEIRKLIREALSDKVRYDTIIIRPPYMDKHASIQLSTKDVRIYDRAYNLFPELKTRYPKLKFFLQSNTGEFLMFESWGKNIPLLQEAAKWLADEIGLPVNFGGLNETLNEGECRDFIRENEAAVETKKSTITPDLDYFFRLLQHPKEIKTKHEIARYNAMIERINLLYNNGMLSQDITEDIEDTYAFFDNSIDKRDFEEIVEEKMDELENLTDEELASEEENPIDFLDDSSVPLNLSIEDLIIQAKGITDYIGAAGYILKDGRLLDFSGGGGDRHEDHRQLAIPIKEDITGTNLMLAFMANTGAVRIDGNAGTMHLRTMPTYEQLQVMRKIFLDNKDDFHIDLGHENKDLERIGPPTYWDMTVDKINSFYGQNLYERKIRKLVRESLLNERGDYFYIDGINYQHRDKNSYPFYYYHDKLAIGEESTSHRGTIYTNKRMAAMFERLTYRLKNKAKTEDEFRTAEKDAEDYILEHAKYNGRVWIDKEVLAFWRFPDKKFLIKIVEDLNNSPLFRERGVKIDGSWKIPVDGAERFENLEDYSGGAISSDKKLNLKNKCGNI